MLLAILPLCKRFSKPPRVLFAVSSRVSCHDAEIFGVGAAGGIRKDDTELKAKLNAALRAVRETGLYDKISEAYFDYSILPPEPQPYRRKR
jgi:ABC-type amino acid transport substrate-binding protein